MGRKIKVLAFICTGSIAIGSLGSICERLVSNHIDSLLPDPREINSFSRPGTITLLSQKKKIIQKLGPATREKVETESMPELVKQAFLAAEDRRYYVHKGVDLWGIGRAALVNLKQRKVVEGGSTITQQVARIIFLSQEQTYSRKIKEIALAYKLERYFSKEEILGQYLNNVYLGSNAYGVADAAWIYFSKTPSELTLTEVALIAGLPPAPSLYSPLVNSDLAIQSRNKVLEKMYLQGFISNETLAESLKDPLILKPAAPKFYKSTAPFFSSWVEQRLPYMLSKEELEVGGLQIQTSLNLEWQSKAQKLIRMQGSEEREGALISIEPSTGLIRALVGGKNFQYNQFNRATQAFRSPGSTFKIFPYALAIKEGFKPEDLLFDTPRCWHGYCPKNFGGKYYGEVSLQEAFNKSLNTIAVDLLTKVGAKKVITLANQLGVGNERKLGEYYPLALGAYEETLLNITGAYAGITNRGVYLKPSPIEEIRGPDNKVIWTQKSNKNKGKRVLSKQVSDTLNEMLKDVVKNGTGIAASLETKQAAGKTGTSEGNRDLLFIGSLPQLTTGIWLGYDDNRSTKSSSGEAAYMWKQFMTQINQAQ